MLSRSLNVLREVHGTHKMQVTFLYLSWPLETKHVSHTDRCGNRDRYHAMRLKWTWTMHQKVTMMWKKRFGQAPTRWCHQNSGKNKVTCWFQGCFAFRVSSCHYVLQSSVWILLFALHPRRTFQQVFAVQKVPLNSHHSNDAALELVWFLREGIPDTMHEYECGSLPPVHGKTYFEPTPKVGQRSAIEFSAKECETKGLHKVQMRNTTCSYTDPTSLRQTKFGKFKQVNAVASTMCASSTNDIIPCPTPPKPERVHETLRPNINVPPKTTVLNMDVSLKQGHLNYWNLLSYCNSSFPTQKLGTTGFESETYLCIYIYT